MFRVETGSEDTPLLYNTEEYNDRCSGLEGVLYILLSYTYTEIYNDRYLGLEGVLDILLSYTIPRFIMIDIKGWKGVRRYSSPKLFYLLQKFTASQTNFSNVWLLKLTSKCTAF